MIMRVLILTEGGGKKGHGHLTRCVALYQAFKEKGANPALIVNGDKLVLHLLEDTNYKIFNWLKNYSKLLKLIRCVDYIVIDSYLAPKSFYNRLSKATSAKLIMIDDLNRLEYPAGIVLNPSIYGDSLNYSNKDGVMYLLGKKYIILRQPFWQRPRGICRKNVKNILIAFGGSKQNRFLEKLLDFLLVNFPNYKYHLVAPGFKPEGRINLNLRTYSNLSALAMSKLMLKCDLCLSAGGQTLYELVCLGIPVIAICFADNQLIGLNFFSQKGTIAEVGWHNENKMWPKLANAFITLLPYEQRLKMIRAGAAVIDGQGSRRVIKKALIR